MRQWDQHCPECGSDDVELAAARSDRLRKRCSGCGHRWSEKREVRLVRRRETYVHTWEMDP